VSLRSFSASQWPFPIENPQKAWFAKKFRKVRERAAQDFLPQTMHLLLSGEQVAVQLCLVRLKFAPLSMF
jgi:hypothetical protein